MKITVVISTDNEAFNVDFYDEVRRALTQAADHVENPGHGLIRFGGSVSVRDSNGNTCGSVTVTES